MSNKERIRLLKIYGPLYARHFHESIKRYECFYCGDKANALDHCPPVSLVEVYNKKFWRQNKIPFVLVPSCTDCNNILSNKHIFTLQERTEFIENKLLRKYEREYNMWSEEEINNMGYSFQIMIRAKKEYASIILERVRFAQERVINYDSFPVWTPDDGMQDNA